MLYRLSLFDNSCLYLLALRSSILRLMGFNNTHRWHTKGQEAHNHRNTTNVDTLFGNIHHWIEPNSSVKCWIAVAYSLSALVFASTVKRSAKNTLAIVMSRAIAINYHPRSHWHLQAFFGASAVTINSKESIASLAATEVCLSCSRCSQNRYCLATASLCSA